MKYKTIFFNVSRTAWFALFLSFMVITPKTINILESDYLILNKIYPRLTLEIYEIVVRETYKKVPYTHIISLIKHESNFTITAIHHNKNGTTDYGIMQINSTNYKGDYNDLFNPVINIRLGVSIYRDCYIAAKGDRETSFRFYNAGRNNKKENYTNWTYVRGIISYIELAKRKAIEFYDNCF